MKRLSRDLLQRAVGQIEGIGLVSDKNIRNALFCAVDMIDAVLREEDGAEDDSDGE